MQPGAKRIASFSKNTLISVKKGNTVSLFVQNKTGNAKTYQCIENGETVATATIPAKSVDVITYKIN